MAYVVKKRCVRCLKRLDDNGNCTNPACPLSKIDLSGNDKAKKTAERSRLDVLL